jgi:hypothetical protein
VRPAELKRLLGRVRRGTLTPTRAARAIAEAPFERMAFATLDHQRALRVGFPEVVFGQGKTATQMVAIVARLAARHPVVLATRVDEAGRAALARAFPHAEVHETARVVILDAARRAARGRARSGAGAARPRRAATGPHDEREPRAARRAGPGDAPARGAVSRTPEPVGAGGYPAGRRRPVGRVLVVCAGTADLPVAEEALLTARVMGSRADLVADVGVAGLHRLLAHRRALRGARVVVVVAGLEGALPSVVGGLTDRPVIAVPTSVGYGAHFRGLAPLLAMLNSCAAGVTVVNVDNGFGAGYAAHLINAGGRRS